MQLLQGGRDVRKEQEALAAFGLQVDEPEQDESLRVWPDNWKPLQVFCRLMTQWRMGLNGMRTGLCYDALPLMLEVCDVPRTDWPDVVDCVQIMERRALVLLNK